MCEYCLNEHCVLINSEASIIVLDVNEDGVCMADGPDNCDFYVEDE